MHDRHRQQVQQSVRQAQKQAAEREEVQCRTEEDAQKHEQTQFPAPDVECKKEQAQQQIHGKKQVKGDSQRSAAAADEPENVIQQTQYRSEQCRDAELHHLQRNRQFHQPNKRRKKPPSRKGA